MSFDSAVQALEGAIETDAAAEASAPSLFAPAPEAPAASPAPSAPQGSDPGATPPAPAVPAPPAAPAPEADTGSFIERADLESLLASTDDPAARAAIERAYKSMLGDYTRKTQEIAPYRKLAGELGVDAEQLRQSVELAQTIQDPNSWPALYSELTQALAQQGYEVPGMQAPQQAPAAPEQPDLNQVIAQLRSDPDLAPVAQLVEGLGQQVETVQSQLQQAVEAARAEQQQIAMVGEFQRQDAVVRESFPHFNEKDMDTVYELAVAHQGNLVQAAQQLEAYRNTILSNYLEGKQQMQGTPVAPVPGGQVQASVPRKPQSLEDATDIAMETLRQAGLDTFTW